MKLYLFITELHYCCRLINVEIYCAILSLQKCFINIQIDIFFINSVEIRKRHKLVVKYCVDVVQFAE